MMKKTNKILLLLCVVLTSFSWAQTVDGGFSTNINGNIYEVILFANMQSDSGTAGVLTLEFTFNDTALSFASNPVDGIDYQLQGDFSNYTTKNITRPLPNRVRVNLLTTSNVTPPLVKLTTSLTDIVTLYFNILNPSQSSNLNWKTTSIAPLFLQNPYTIGNWPNTNTILPVEYEEDLVPETSEIFQNYPNPFNSSTVIKFQLPKESKVAIKIYNIIGTEVFELLNDQKEAGIYEVEFKADNLPSGAYIYRITADNFIETKKMILLK